MNYPGLLNKAKTKDNTSDIITVNSIEDLSYNSKSGSIAEVVYKGVKELTLDDILPKFFYISINNNSIGNIAYADGGKTLSIQEDLTAVYYDQNNQRRILKYKRVAIQEHIYREYEIYDNLKWKNLNNIKLFAFRTSKVPYIYNGDEWEQMDYVQKSDFVFDSAPTQGSSNLLTSEVIYNELSNKADLINGKVPSDQLPSYVDDVIEFPSLLNFPQIGESGKIYIDVSTNTCYRWSGSVYIEIQSPIELDEYPIQNSTNAIQSGGVYSALQEKQDVIPDLSEIRQKVETALQTETDPTVPNWAKEDTKPTYTYSEILDTPTNVSEFTNDSGYLTSQDISGKQDILTAGDGIAIDNEDIIRTTGIPFGRCDNTSTATAFTATVPGIYKLEDGVCCMIKNGVITSKAGFTLNVNGLGAKHCYNNMAAATAETTLFNINYTILFVYDSTRGESGGWIYYRGYDSVNSNSIGYQLRNNNAVLPVSDTARYYKLYFTSADGTMRVPASINSTNNATTIREVNQRPIDPFGQILYTSATTNYTAGTNLAAATAWSQYALALGYSFNRTGAALELTFPAPIYIKCAPQTDGSAIIDANTPYVQSLPSTNDGKIYIFLGIAYNATNVELLNNHPVYYNDGTGTRLWTGKDCAEISIDDIKELWKQYITHS